MVQMFITAAEHSRLSRKRQKSLLIGDDANRLVKRVHLYSLGATHQPKTWGKFRLDLIESARLYLEEIM